MKNLHPLVQLQEHVQAMLALDTSSPQFSYLSEKLQSSDMQTLLKERHAQKDFDNMLKALNRGASLKAQKHAQRTLNHLRLTSNDTPFKEGDRVSVTRFEHGWPDGAIGGVVYSARQYDGIWHYCVKITYENYDEKLDKPYYIEVNHTRDLSFDH